MPFEDPLHDGNDPFISLATFAIHVPRIATRTTVLRGQFRKSCLMAHPRNTVPRYQELEAPENHVNQSKQGK